VTEANKAAPRKADLQDLGRWSSISAAAAARVTAPVPLSTPTFIE
jgi:hypothetical protein